MYISSQYEQLELRMHSEPAIMMIKQVFKHWKLVTCNLASVKKKCQL